MKNNLKYKRSVRQAKFQLTFIQNWSSCKKNHGTFNDHNFLKYHSQVGMSSISVTDSKIRKQEATSIKSQRKKYDIINTIYWRSWIFFFFTDLKINLSLCRFSRSQSREERLQYVQKEESSQCYCSGLWLSRFRSCFKQILFYMFISQLHEKWGYVHKHNTLSYSTKQQGELQPLQ